jgi:hypothetical protein
MLCGHDGTHVLVAHPEGGVVDGLTGKDGNDRFSAESIEGHRRLLAVVAVDARVMPPARVAGAWLSSRWVPTPGRRGSDQTSLNMTTDHFGTLT